MLFIGLLCMGQGLVCNDKSSLMDHGTFVSGVSFMNFSPKNMQREKNG